MVIIEPSQGLDPGSIPGRRKIILTFNGTNTFSQSQYRYYFFVYRLRIHVVPSIAQLAEHSLSKRKVASSTLAGGFE